MPNIRQPLSQTLGLCLFRCGLTLPTTDFGMQAVDLCLTALFRLYAIGAGLFDQSLKLCLFIEGSSLFVLGDLLVKPRDLLRSSGNALLILLAQRIDLALV